MKFPLAAVLVRFPRLATAILAVALGFSSTLRAQVQASLVAESTSVQPGQPFTVALRLVHEPHWHTYWINPGTGLATTIAWTLPAGWKAGPIEWPAPKLLSDSRGNVVGNGYSEDLLLPVTITPSADAKPGTAVELKADANWLVCQDECVPGEAKVSLSLPVSKDAPAADPQWGEKIHAVVAGLPTDDAGWSVSATREAKNVVLTIKPKGTAAHTPANPHFFSEDGFTAYDQPQGVKLAGGGVVLTLPVSDDGPKDPAKLVGVVTSDNGWRRDGSLEGLQVDASFKGSASNATDASGPRISVPKLPSSNPPGGPSGSHPPAPPADASNGAPGTGAVSLVSLLGTLLLAFVGGLILNLMPCVFPVLGIKILGFVNQAGSHRRKVVAHGLIFSLGVLFSFWALAGVLAVLRAGGTQLGWGFQLQSPVFVFGLAAVMLVFALNMSGVFEFGLSATGVGGELQMKSGYGGSFFTGVLATVVATPCSAPFLAPALGAALALPAVESFTVFTAIAVGLSTPYLLLSIFPAAVKALPRPGAWMETFKQLMAFPLYATVGYLLWVLAGQVPENGLLSAFFGLTLIAMAVWAYGRWHGPGASAGRIRFAWASCLVLLALGAWTGWPRQPVATDIAWEKWSPSEVNLLRSEGRIVYVDFTARWCATCQANKKLVFHSDDVLETFHDRHIATLRGDWTNRDPQITAELAKYSRSAVPFNVVWLPGRDAPVILPELLTPSIVLKAVKGSS